MDKLLLFLIKTISLQPFVSISQPVAALAVVAAAAKVAANAMTSRAAAKMKMMRDPSPGTPWVTRLRPRTLNPCCESLFQLSSGLYCKIMASFVSIMVSRRRTELSRSFRAVGLLGPDPASGAINSLTYPRSPSLSFIQKVIRSIARTKGFGFLYHKRILRLKCMPC